ncbi:hypothetical protein AVEN_253192-1 [Araneus ventricosus]|uniref:Uncharacterized protein n=1 Tax=Araneus ventricosus TaxID=182803 RepID=A0A4Y2SJC0_ARAVE|nr:hypothetical protein AVEN_243429-1 [Araneus ventricosus]GBN88325.1 hypothetical protein AVEN_253192-1 [Araneus ventricosus]
MRTSVERFENPLADVVFLFHLGSSKYGEELSPRPPKHLLRDSILGTLVSLERYCRRLKGSRGFGNEDGTIPLCPRRSRRVRVDGQEAGPCLWVLLVGLFRFPHRRNGWNIYVGKRI